MAACTHDASMGPSVGPDAHKHDLAVADDLGGPPASIDGGAASTFRHPGVLVNREQLDFVKAKIAAGAEPWASAFTLAKNSKYGALNYAPSPIADVDCGPYSNPNVGCSAEQGDVIAAYTQALLWYFTGNESYAKNAVAILNAWSSTLTMHTNSNAPLQSAWCGSVFPRAAEIIRYTYSGWVKADIDRFASLLRTAYLPYVIKGAANDNGNWELSMAEASMAIGVFLDDPATFSEAVSMWRKRVPAYIYLQSDGPMPVPPPGGNKTSSQALIAYWQGQSMFVDGLGQETCRDFGHLTFGFAAIVNAAETARIQGLDLYAEQAKRITTGFEFNAQFLDGVAAPAWLCGGTLNLPGNPTWEIGDNEYVNREGMSLPHTLDVILKNRPSSANHHIAWETLTHAGVGSAGIH
jgi:hypothetical protein